MAKITALRIGRTGNMVDIFVDNDFLSGVHRDVIVKVGLRVGQELTIDQIDEIKKANLVYICYEAALQYLGYRARSEAEVSHRLCRRGFDSEVVDEVIVKLKEQKLIDDTAFAQYWRDNRLSYSPRSRRLIKSELRLKGISAEIAEDMIEDIDDEASAFEVGCRKARTLATADYDEFCRRLSGHLRWRGFSYEVINRVITCLWQQQKNVSIHNSFLVDSLDTNTIDD